MESVQWVTPELHLNVRHNRYRVSCGDMLRDNHTIIEETCKRRPEPSN